MTCPSSDPGPRADHRPRWQPDPEQRAVLEAPVAGAMLAWGSPGTGRTSVIVESVGRHLDAGGSLHQVMVLAASRPAAQQLRAQIIRRSPGSHLHPKVMTVHALALSLVTEAGLVGGPGGPEVAGQRAPVRLLTAPEQEFRIRELLAHHDVSSWPADLAHAAGTRAFAAEVRLAAARVRQLGMDPQDVAELAECARRPEWAGFAEFFDEYLDVLDAEQVIDYAEVVHRARLALLDPVLLERTRTQLQRIWCDDLGENDPSQLQLLADLVGAGIPLLATGDPLTSVFGFRGADQRVFEDFSELFANPAGVRTQLLRTNHRNPPAVRAAMDQLIGRIPRPTGFAVADLPQVRPDDQDGSPVSVLIADSDGAQAEHIADLLRSAHLRDGLAWDQLAVITRSGGTLLPLLSRTLSNAGVPVQVDAEDVALAQAQAARTLLGGLQAALAIAQDQPLDPDQVQALLRSPLAGLDGLALRLLGRQLRAEAADQRLDVLGSAQWTTLLVSRPDELPHVSPTPAAEAARALGRVLRGVAARIGSGASAAEALWELWSSTSWPARLQHTALENSEHAALAHRDLDVVLALFDVAGRDASVRGPRAIAALVAEVAGQEIPADHARESDPSSRGVRLLTAHRAKGESFALVVVAGLAEGVWPVTSRVGTILQADRLGADEVAPGAGFSALLAAERRLFLLAISRSTDRLVVTCSVGTEGEGNQPSRFINELGVEPRRVVGRPAHPLTLTGLVAQLRRAATDPSASPDLREAAARRLALLAEQTDRHGRAMVPGADPARWWGVADFSRAAADLVRPGAALRLSGSELETLVTCPRQWFLKRQARAEGARGSASSLGSVIHVLIDHASAEGASTESLEQHLDRVWDQIPFDAQWLSASERSEAQAALQRYAVWDGRNPRAVVGSEVPFTLEVELPEGPVQLNGTVDRLEQDSEGRLHIIDFKTGRSVPTKAAAAASPQLGLYQLAAQRGAFAQLAPTATGVGGAELVYLRKDAKGSATVLPQASLDDLPRPSDPSDAAADPAGAARSNWVLDLVADAARTVRGEQFTAQPGEPVCTFCPFTGSCPAHVSEEVGR